MFRLFVMLVYFLPAIYLYLRINRVFISPGYKLLFTVVFILLVLVFPLSGFFAGSEAPAYQRILAQISGYLLPFFLYVFLLILLYDLFLIFNHFTGWISVETRHSFSYRAILLASVSVVSFLIVLGGAINLATIRVSEYNVSIPRKSSDLKKLKVVFVSDIHIHAGVPLQFIESYVAKVNELRPDIVLYGGDIVDDRNVHPEPEKLVAILKEIQPHFGVYGVLGNHEFYRGHTDGSFFRKAGIVLLNDSLVKIDNSIIVAGRYDEHFRNRKSIAEILGGRTPDLPVILVDHRPTRFDEAVSSGIDVQFSGHTHNGQLFPFNLIIKKMYELGWGYLKKGNTHFFVSSGLRLWGPPVKTAGKAEIMLVNVNFD